VKKYHQSPGLGVRSGSRNLSRSEHEVMQGTRKGNVYPAPQVFRIHPQPPATKVEANTKATKEMVNSTSKGMHLESFCVNGFGDARCDRGSERRSKRTGRSKRIAGKDRCDRTASVKRERDDWPREHQNREHGRGDPGTYLAKQT
jgi:hypothetical protein